MAPPSAPLGQRAGRARMPVAKAAASAPSSSSPPAPRISCKAPRASPPPGNARSIAAMPNGNTPCAAAVGRSIRRIRSRSSGRKSLCRVEHVLFLFYEIDSLSRPALDDAAFQKHHSPPMTLQPLLNAPFVIPIHALAAITAFAVGLLQLTAPKGTIPHRLIGWSWVMLMLTVAVSSLIHPQDPAVGSVEARSTAVHPGVGDIAAGGDARPPARHRAASHIKADAFTGALVIAGGSTPSCPAGSCTPWYSARSRQPLHEPATRFGDVLGRAGEGEAHPAVAVDRVEIEARGHRDPGLGQHPPAETPRCRAVRPRHRHRGRTRLRPGRSG